MSSASKGERDSIPRELYSLDDKPRRFLSQGFDDPWSTVARGGALKQWPLRAMLFTSLILGVGFVLLAVGVPLLVTATAADRHQGIALVVVGAICFVPGVWSAYNITCGIMGYEGFNLSFFYEW
ncbi:hypothetical protein FVE85_2069 [Porphyridium purpureum]|uniref:Transmembrane protein n=1 Tax=Porphyridium purpureum TaxID=35688 RepID=A0A5J4YYW8_PORPP|nr:hypothetical protein FVE85_2069 [Porphyridium purpureum]|eukprot:POR8839..scf209_3